ncbi:MAG: GHKL domain-containing protein [Magnetococcales bacterium]|nr:GHKL domain-containing protein [Magnetococcales bacterium]
MTNPTRSVAIKHSISMKLLKMVFGTYCLATVILTAVQMWIEYSRETEEVVQTLVTYQPLFEKTLSNNVWHVDLAQLDVTINSILQLPEVVGVSILDPNNRFIARKGLIDIKERDTIAIDMVKVPETPPRFAANLFDHHFDLLAPSESGVQEKLGRVIFYSNSDIAFSRVNKLFWSIIFFASIKTLFLWVVFLYFGNRLVGKPLLNLVQETARFSRNQTGKSLRVVDGNVDEIQQLDQSFAAMEAQLRESMDSLSQGYARLDAVAAILEISSGSKPINTLFHQVLDELVNRAWLPVQNRKILGACIFLVDPNQERLVMQAHINMPDGSIESCQHVEIGSCLCGQAFKRREMVQARNLHDNELSNRHSHSLDDNDYYAIPICSSDRSRVIGVLTGYFQSCHGRHTSDADFLGSIANALSSLIERKYAEDALKTHQDYLENMVATRTKQLAHAERLACLGTFSAGMAHEVNNPNSFIAGNIDFLKQFWMISRPILDQNKHLDPTGRVGAFLTEVDATLDGMLDGSRRISKIVDSLKAYSRGGMETDKVECRLLDPVQDAGNLLKYRIKKGFALKIDVPTTIMVICDRQQMTQVFVNLFNNAMDAMENMDITGAKQITVHAEMLDDHVWIRVKDQGPGILPGAQGKIFDPFYTSKGKTKGTGLGLSIVQGIIEDHAGQITVFSTPEKMEGAEFLIILPNRENYQKICDRRKCTVSSSV